MKPGTDPQLAGLGRKVVGRDRVLEQGLDARDERPGTDRRADGRRGRPPAGGRWPPANRLAGGEVEAREGEGGGSPARAELPAPCRRRSPRPERSRRVGSTVGEGVAARYDLAPCGTATSPACRPTRPRSAGLPCARQRAERAGRGQQRGQGGKVGQSVPRAGPPFGRRRGTRRALRSLRCRVRASLDGPCVLDLGVDRPDVEVDDVLVLGLGWRAAKSSATSSAIRRSRPRRPRRGGVVDSGIGLVVLALEDATPARLRAADPRLVGRAIDLAGRGKPVGVGLAQLEGVEPVRCLARAVAGRVRDPNRCRAQQVGSRSPNALRTSQRGAC